MNLLRFLSFYLMIEKNDKKDTLWFYFKKEDFFMKAKRVRLTRIAVGAPSVRKVPQGCFYI